MPVVDWNNSAIPSIYPLPSLLIKLGNKALSDVFCTCLCLLNVHVLGMTLKKLIRCCPQYDVKLMWRHRGNDFASVAAICAAVQLIFLFGRTLLTV